MQIRMDTGEISRAQNPQASPAVHMEAFLMGVVSLQYGMPHGEP